ncbi:signal transduction protein [Thermotomaculum hydrothermale]|uniref:diguanylate cyclase n=1 Tax=Thermotomaculum hydrothermale TaxID=981385 RepID=A0A7R6SZT0_9BACT|nr:diguanylate cyclase [Thermotomaculum hydrothermale]BBB33120.1 signal transduction protein [Thermotomaculum hydrothermale]
MSLDYSKPIEIAEDIFWVGYKIPDDSFQCHVYLIRNGDESVLIDPGSMITFPVTINKITSLINLNDIKYIICHHQDPDITGCISTLEKLIPRKDKFIVTHWRTQTLLKHYQWETPFYLVEKNKWKLFLKNGRVLDFIFTPYAHFAGAFCTFDRKTKTLFSSDIFGGFTEEFSLFAEDESYFASLKAFHEHYIPSKEILLNALIEIEKKEPELIAPQHGSIIKKELIPYMINRLKELNCGLFLLSSYESNIEILLKTNQIINAVFSEVVNNSDFLTVLRKTFSTLKENNIPIRDIITYVYDKGEKGKEWYDIFSVIKGEISQKETSHHKAIIKNLVEGIQSPKCMRRIKLVTDTLDEYQNIFCIPLTSKRETLKASAYFIMEKELSDKDRKTVEEALDKLIHPISSSLANEVLIKELGEEKKELFNTAIHDSLTGLKNRVFLDSIASNEISKAIRYEYPISVIIFDIDHFKTVNDTYGHLAGDFVLQEISKIIKASFRTTDYVIRYGGEEIVAILPYAKEQDACKRAEHIRKMIEGKEFVIGNNIIKTTISAGVYERRDETDIYEIIGAADKRLYRAKESGRNKVICKD